MPTEISYLVLIFCLFVIPPMLIRLRIPAGITAFIMGAIFAWKLQWFSSDDGLPLLAKFGIIALFLLAGMEVDLPGMKRDARPILSHVSLRLAMLAIITWLLYDTLQLSAAASCLFALALLTPSTGFILDSLDQQPLAKEEKGWVRTIAISMEISALIVLFFALQSSSLPKLLAALAAFALMIALLPLVFRFFAKVIAPYAPRSEFAFVLMIALLAGHITHKLGTYYLVGAFIVGITAQQFRTTLPRATSFAMLSALKVFAFFFLPFYFFKAGRSLAEVEFTFTGFGIGLLLLAIIVPLRLGMTWLQLKFILKTDIKEHKNVATALLPNLIFGIVLSEILRDKFQLDAQLYLALIVYTVGISIVPAIILKTAVSTLSPPWTEDLITMPKHDQDTQDYYEEEAAVQSTQENPLSPENKPE